MNSSLLPRPDARTRYNIYRASLLVTISILAFIIPSVYGSPPSQPTSDAGSRYHICFTATDSIGNLTTTKCLYITVIGACTLATADVNIDGQVDIGDLSIIALHYHENKTKAEAYNPMDTPQVGLEDLACVASYYHQTDPLP